MIDSPLTSGTKARTPIRRRGAWVVLVLLAGLVGCGSPLREQAYDKVANSGLRSVLLLQVPNTDLQAVNLGSAYSAFGLIGAALGEEAERKKSSELDASLRGQVHLGSELTAALEAELERRGFDVQVSDQRPWSNAGPDTAAADERFDYRSIKTHADAILHVTILGAGYLATSQSRNYEPWLYVRARMLVQRSNTLVYVQFLVYGANLPETKSHIPAQPQYAYRDFESLIRNASAAGAGLQAGAPLVAERIAQQLR